jgi:class 3 adenylate cyclase
VEPGDLIRSVDGLDVRGFSVPRFWSLILGNGGDRAVLEIERGGEVLHLVVRRIPWPHWWATLPCLIGIGLVATFLLIRARDWRIRRPFFVASIGWSLFGGWFYLAGGWFTRASNLIEAIGIAVGLALALRCCLTWTEASPPLRRWQSTAIWVPSVLLVGLGTYAAYFPITPGSVLPDLQDGLFGAALLGIAACLVVSSRRATAIERRQGKWIVFGVLIALVPFGAIFITSSMGSPLPIWLHTGTRLGLVAIPLGFLVAITAYGFLDIDRILSASATYTLLAIGLVGGLLALMPGLSAWLSAAAGIDAGLSQAAVALGLAAVAVPFYRVLNPRIENVLFAERRALTEGIGYLLNELAAQRDPRELTGAAGQQLDAQFRPESCVVYAQAGAGFEPVFARGKAVPPAVAAQSPLVTTLQARAGPLAADRFSRRDRIEQLSLFDRAALDTLGAAVVVPVRQRGQLAAFLCLGPKRSGDIYTSTDLALLTAVANAASTQLERMDQEEITREARSMQRELRRYVPGAIATELEAGADLEPRERPVSVLFVDIRGYATYSESRQAHEVFTTINRYTQTVSAIVEKFGGSVVEFNGDGMMAVFGAPTPLPDKERAALSTGREMVATVPTVGGSEPLAVGVGIATGSAFVGSIQASDRMIWTALGNTTNLAARLQGLTRDLDAAMVIDLATWRAAGEPPEFERRDQVQIRGRSQREDVCVLPLPSAT